MEVLRVVLAAAAAYAFGAVWYMLWAKPWVAAAGVATDDQGRPAHMGDKMPFVVSGVCALLVAGMMRHVFMFGGIDTPLAGLVAGLGMGLFIATPWLATNYAFAGRPRMLTLIDGGYATGGCTLMGLVLTLL
ncbi:MAG: DUF1761 domain-containing protein [Rhodobacteraceae bacterium]|nr:DUF1761 domain-containing protein [Paracoccaceae bacterium]